jgi:ATP-dependent Clp protease ATP-binding subunit ClpX
MTNKKKTQCSFCGKVESEVEHVVGNDNTFICNECVESIMEIMLLEDISVDKKQRERDVKKLKLEMTPSKIKSFLDDYVIGQDSAKITIAISVYNHFKRLKNKTDVEIAKSNILMIGPTGTGKTMIAQTVAKLLDVPFAIADATSLTEAGYVGNDVETILQRLYNASNGDISKAETGIIFIDEIDKIAKKGVGQSVTRDVSGEGVQQALLKIIEGAIVDVPTEGLRKSANSKNVQMDTSKILFVCAGAFVDLEEIVKTRKAKEQNVEKSIGFGASIETPKEITEILEDDITPEDLTKFGLIPEFIGRIPVICKLDELDKEALTHILTKPKNSIVKQYTELFAMDGCQLEFTEEAIEEVASRAFDKKTGARGLKSMIEKILKPYMFSLPDDVASGYDKLTITKEMLK